MATHDLLSPSFSFDKHMSFRLNFNPEFTSRLLLDPDSDTDGEDEEEEDSGGEEEREGEEVKEEGGGEDEGDLSTNREAQAKEGEQDGSKNPQAVEAGSNFNPEVQVTTGHDEVRGLPHLRESGVEIDSIGLRGDTNRDSAIGKEINQNSDATEQIVQTPGKEEEVDETLRLKEMSDQKEGVEEEVDQTFETKEEVRQKTEVKEEIDQKPGSNDDVDQNLESISANNVSGEVSHVNEDGAQNGAKVEEDDDDIGLSRKGPVEDSEKRQVEQKVKEETENEMKQVKSLETDLQSLKEEGEAAAAKEKGKDEPTVVQDGEEVATSEQREEKTRTAEQEGGEEDRELEDDELSDSESHDVSTMEVPRHPMPAMQGAFGESMIEASSNQIRISKKGDSAARRKFLLDQGASEDTHAGKWHQQPGQQWHQLWKLMSQISFGIYLLLNGLARDDNQVLAILQGHVDEVDDFLETTLDDFDLAQEDINVRVKHLMMPLENIDIFEAMLEDRQFRLQIVNGNERIEHIITRTAKAMNDALKDVEEGLAATKVFVTYLAQEQHGSSWKVERPDMLTVFDAMKGNAGGWQKAYLSLQGKGQNLGVALAQLSSIVADMNRRAADISRRMTMSTSPDSSRKSTVSSPLSSPPGSHMSRPSASSMTKELPPDPAVLTPAILAAFPNLPQVGNCDRAHEPGHSSNSGAKEQFGPEQHQDKNAEAKEKYGTDTRQATSTDVLQEPHPISEIEPFQTLRSVTYTSVHEPTLQIDDIIDYQISAFPQPPGTPRSEGVRSPSERSQSPRSPNSTPVSPNSPTSLSRNPSSRIAPSRSPIPTSPPHSATSDSAYFSSSSSAASPSIPLVRTPRGPSLSSFPAIQATAMRPPTIQPFFPAPAAPHKLVQRPWTAAPPNHQMRRPSLAKIRTTNVTKTSQLSHSMSVSNKTSKSQLSEVVTFDTPEQEVKHKKSGSSFGWIKKAFSLTEEEKSAFERRRKGPAPPTRPIRPAKTPIVDGRRMR